MAELSFDKIGFRVDGRDEFLISGEFHYFRVPAQDWKRRMELFKQSGGNCLATYVPWLIHEPEEGRILFGDVPNRDLVGFLQTAREVGLKVLLRPGPYQYSELINDGLPTWLVEKYPEILAQDQYGHAFRESSVSYLHPLFLKKARRYFRAFAEVVRPFMGDPVAMLQTDNELAGIHVWFGSLDYHPVTMGIGAEEGRYPRFLQKKYGTLQALNQAYQTDFSTWAEVLPVDSGDLRDPVVCRRKQDYQDFYCDAMAEYMNLLASWLREDGLTVPICHNSGNPNMNSLFTETVERMGENFLLGSDHYYTLHQGWAQNNPTPQYAVHVFHSMEEMRLMGMPPSVLEMPGGSPSDTPPILPQDLLACYQTNLAMGMKGVNYYVYTGGPNFPDTGTTCGVYDYNALVRADGSLNATYRSMETFNRFMRDNAWMQRGGRRASAVVGFEWRSTRCRDFDCRGYDFSRADCWKFARLGVIYTMLCSRYAPEMVNLDGALDRSRPLIVPCASAMSENAQRRLIDFVQAGGQLLLLGALPEVDDEYRPCTLLRDHLGGVKTQKFPRGSGVVRHKQYGEVYGLTPVQTVEALPEGAHSLFTERETGKTIGFELSRGDGRVIFLACQWKMTTFDQAELMEALLDKLGARPCVKSSNRNIFTSLWEDECGNRLPMVMNLYSSPQQTEVEIYEKDGTLARRESLSLDAMEVRVLK